MNGYEIKQQIVGDDFTTIEVAYTLDGHYIGEPAFADKLVAKMGIAPELAKPTNKVCSIGFCEKNRKWYGWSHRAIVGFGLGDKLFDPSVNHAKDTPFVQVGTITIKTLAEAKEAARRFAEYVG